MRKGASSTNILYDSLSSKSICSKNSATVSILSSGYKPNAFSNTFSAYLGISTSKADGGTTTSSYSLSVASITGLPVSMKYSTQANEYTSDVFVISESSSKYSAGR